MTANDFPSYANILYQKGLEQQQIAFSASYANALQNQNYQRFCIHANCPICEENNKRAREEAKIIEQRIEEKHLKYQNKCKEYMKWFRERGRNGTGCENETNKSFCMDNKQNR